MGAFPPVARGSSIVVPDDVATVQLGIDSGADTVLIREGSYPERPVVKRAVVLIGLGQRPRLLGMNIYNTNFSANPPLLQVNNVDFAGRVAHTQITHYPWNLRFGFLDCALDSGFVATNPEYDNLQILDFTRCRMLGSGARANQVIMEADTIDDGVAWDTYAASIQHCWFRGGAWIAISSNHDPYTGLIHHNRIENYRYGIRGQYGLFDIHDNTILNCDTGILLESSEGAISNNEIRECGFTGAGIDLRGRIFVVANRIMRSRGVGVSLYYPDVTLERNVVGQGEGDGIVLEGAYPYDTDVLRGNTIFGNRGSGIVIKQSNSGISIKNNIAFGNLAWGVRVLNGQEIAFACNDWFGNGSDVYGTAGATDLSVDPMFCDASAGDVTLDAHSPLADASGCGQIGALGVGCGQTVGVPAAQVGSAFRLVEVGPSPGRGAVRIAFALPRAAEIELDVFDLLGRRVTSLARGEWPAGTHQLEWNGQTRNGRPAQSGVYVLRYAHPGGQDQRRMVRVR
jgi:parallel beta-helix repeat protein